MCDFSLKQDLFSLLAEKGAKLIGAADLTGIVSNEMQTGVSVAVPIPKSIVEDLKTAPTQAYYEAYSSMNAKLDEMVSCGEEFLRDRGYRHLPIPLKL